MWTWSVLNHFTVPDVIGIKHPKHGCPPSYVYKTPTASNLFSVWLIQIHIHFLMCKCPCIMPYMVTETATSS